MRGQLLLGEKRWKERRDLARPDETSSVAHCFVSRVFLSFSLQNFRSVSPSENPGPPLQAAGEKRRRRPAPGPPGPGSPRPASPCGRRRTRLLPSAARGRGAAGQRPAAPREWKAALGGDASPSSVAGESRLGGTLLLAQPPPSKSLALRWSHPAKRWPARVSCSAG